MTGKLKKSGFTAFPRVDLRLCKLPASEIAGNGTCNDLMPRIFLSLKICLTIYCVFAIIALDELAEPLRGWSRKRHRYYSGGVFFDIL